MSQTNSVKPLNCINLMDPRLECLEQGQSKLEWGIEKGASYSNTIKQVANAQSTSGITWNFNTQGQTTMIDRRLYAEVKFQVVFTGTAPIGVPLLNDNLSAPRAFTLASVCESLSCTINGTSVSVAYADVMQAITRYNNTYDLSEFDLSGTPTFLDNFSTYSQGIASSRNPLANYQNSGYEQGRGSFFLNSIVNPLSTNPATPITATIQFTVYEPLIMSPLLYNSSKLESALIGVNNIGVQMNFGGNLTRVWSHSAASAGENITNVAVTLVDKPNLHVTYLNTPLTDESMIPRVAVYNYTRLEAYENQVATAIPSTSSISVVNNSIQLSIVPQMIYIYCARPRGNKLYTQTDTFLTIDSLSLQYLNVSGQFSSMSQFDLYQLSVKNGCKMSFQEWTGKASNLTAGTPEYLTGSVIAISSTDLALPSNLAAGAVANSQLQITLTITNNSPNQYDNYSVYVVVAQPGMLSISEGSAMTQIGVISQEDILETRANKEWRPLNLHKSMYGGDFWSSLKNFGKNFLKGAEAVLPVASQVLPFAKAALGSGKKGGNLVSSVDGGAYVGGKSMSRADLKKLLM